MDNKNIILKEYFGHSSFREGQGDIVDSLVNGRDVLAVMPTGAGKSICYQVPALMLPGITLVVSPLISLMNDQVAALIQNGIPAAYFNSSLTYNQYRKALSLAERGRYKIIYVAPERLLTPEFLDFCNKVTISLVAVDEAHCVSQWGPDFRPSYLKIAEFIESFNKRPVVGAFTATATREVKDDIGELLKLRNPFAITTGFDRPNLTFSVVKPLDKMNYLTALVKDRSGKSGIIYCSTRKAVEEISEMLATEKISVTRYHAGLSPEERKQNQEDFVYDRKLVMVATNAFGMGIDKSNVSFVIHYNMPKDIESYYQEAGRAGRDGSEAECILLYAPRDINTIKYFIENPQENGELTENEQAELAARELERLKYMTYYCTTQDCLRSFILKYFGDTAPAFCEKCSNCLTHFEPVDITEDAQKIISCIIKTGQRYGKGLICDALRGMKNQKVLNFGLDRQSTYGLLSNYSKNELYNIFDFLEHNEYIVQTQEQFPILKVTEKYGEILHNTEKLIMKLPKKSVGTSSHGTVEENINHKLFSALKVLRKQIADRASVPAFVIFSDATLKEMCIKQPVTQADFLEISGVGATKYNRYGEEFMEVIKHFQ